MTWNTKFCWVSLFSTHLSHSKNIQNIISKEASDLSFSKRSFQTSCKTWGLGSQNHLDVVAPHVSIYQKLIDRYRDLPRRGCLLSRMFATPRLLRFSSCVPICWLWPARTCFLSFCLISKKGEECASQKPFKKAVCSGYLWLVTFNMSQKSQKNVIPWVPCCKGLKHRRLWVGAACYEHSEWIQQSGVQSVFPSEIHSLMIHSDLTKKILNELEAPEDSFSPGPLNQQRMTTFQRSNTTCQRL